MFQEGSSTPPAQPRPEQPPPRIRRRTLRRRRQRRQSRQRTTAGQNVVSDSATGAPNTRRRLQSISQQDNQMQTASELAVASAGLISGSLVVSSMRRVVSNSAVRVLFSDQQHYGRQAIPGGRRASDTSVGNCPNDATLTNYHHQLDHHHRETARRVAVAQSRQRSISVAEASRRLIERQIEAMQEADSRRWNFDFRNCRPMHEIGHRYVDCSMRVLDGSASPGTNLNQTDQLDDNNNSNPAIPITASNNPGNSTHQPPETQSIIVRTNIKPLNDKNQNH